MIAKRSVLLALGAAPLLASPLARAAAAYDGSRRTLSWSAWRRFAAEAVSDEGRLIDSSDARLITTSEGQSYGLFFALVDDDRELYEKLRRWTVDNLCAGDIGKNLPAWLWGKTEESAPKTNDLSRGAKAPAPAPRSCPMSSTCAKRRPQAFAPRLRMPPRKAVPLRAEKENKAWSRS